MNHEELLIKGKLARDCDEKKTELVYDDKGNLIRCKQYCRARDKRKRI